MKKYIELKKNPAATHLCVETYYDLGGTSWSTGRIKERGYYLRVKPVTKETRYGVQIESFVAFTGIYQLVKPVTRQSAKAAQAADIAAAEIEKTLIEYVLKDQQLELA